ncbi:hypothetical protein LPJ73_005715 [Coemansia sp. RSA 2703]|nr:hypothetical protein LPJ73_005715 [Coemansia sp. RSA 2703]KAJ2391252.1 hypothetical protein GGI05_002995 [Coemansia sp. RSA 2603]
MIKQSEVHHTTDHGFVMIMGGEAGWILKTVKAKLTNWNYEQVNVDEEYWDYVEVNANEEDCDYEQISMKEVCGYEQINMNEEDLIEYSANCLEHAFDDKRTVYEYAFGSMKQPSAVMSGNRECITSRFAVLTIIYNQNESETVIVEFVNFEDENNIEASLYYDAQS